ncbi:c-type cytochrome [Litchfieldella xinjiangensis]|uniref:c-type cytochrome n=1 Tax=Litchfieldella xinjiangensis TaxID=1166948 RepID=UPI0005BDCB68|nr:cytochrome c [Halomonas xinjiangensis]
MAIVIRLLSIALLSLFLGSQATHAQAPAQDRDPSRDALIEKGEYLARAGDCVACHTADENKMFAGGLAMQTPIGTIYSTNITPDPETGIGRYTLEDFTRAMREGVTPAGHALYPAMPYPSYARITDEDMQALYVYFLHGVEPIQQQNRDSVIPWPLSMRWPLRIWSWMFTPDETGFDPDPERSDEWNRGAYLVEGLGHCGACHTPRGLAYQEQGFKAGDNGFLGGEMVEGWYSFNITSDSEHGIGGWRDDEIVAYLRDGAVPGKAHAAGPMGEVIGHSLRYLDDADLYAIATYLKSVPPISDPEPSRFGQGEPADDVERMDDPGFVASPQGQAAKRYLTTCAYCHGDRGEGSRRGDPSLFNSSVVGSTHLNNLVRVILEGVARETNQGQVTMPGYADELDDEQMAQLVNYLVDRFGNPEAETLAPEDIAAMRSTH